MAEGWNLHRYRDVLSLKLQAELYEGQRTNVHSFPQRRCCYDRYVF